MQSCKFKLLYIELKYLATPDSSSVVIRFVIKIAIIVSVFFYRLMWWYLNGSYTSQPKKAYEPTRTVNLLYLMTTNLLILSAHAREGYSSRFVGLFVCLSRSDFVDYWQLTYEPTQIYWRASEASETVVGVDNAKSVCYMDICV